jgi:aryl-alcohol dehydrogenase-like predicted oxidoreductase
MISNLNLVSPIKNEFPFGIGCWQIGGPTQIDGKPAGWKSISENEVEAIFNQCIEIGIRTFDTSNIYGNGWSEKLIGKYVSSNPEVKIITKFGNVMLDNGKKELDFSVSNLLKSLDSSLTRLKRSTIDTFLFHGFPENPSKIEDAMVTLENLKSEGVIKHWGFSVNRIEHAKYCLGNNLGDTIELIYNLLERRVEAILPELSAKKFRVIARSPFANGLIHKRMLGSEIPQFHNEDILNIYPKEVLLWFSNQLKENLFLNNPEQLMLTALRYLLCSEVYKIVPGIRSLAHVEIVKMAYEAGPLTENEKEKITSSLPKFYPNWK